jgi:NAD(P)-dependent dehydrogenase (short-subunit alcohol dehydrogenase family)
MRFSSEVAVVTGAASGIGRALCGAILREGGSVLAVDRDWPEAVPGPPDPPGLSAVAADVRDGAALQSAIEQLSAGGSRPTILVNAAGVAGPEKPFEGIDLDAWREAIDVNLWGAALCTSVVLPHLVDGRSTILNVVSHAGLTGARDASAYAASKGGLIAFTLSLAAELTERGISVNGFLPGPTDTGLMRARRRGDEIDALVAEGYIATAEEVAEAALVLISPDGRRISGQIVGARPAPGPRR